MSTQQDQREVWVGLRLGIRLCTALGALLALCLLWPHAADAHPLGNFTVNHYSLLHFADGAVRITYILDEAEIPTFQQMKQLDTDGDSQLSTAEASAYLDATLPGLLANLHFAVGSQSVALAVAERSAVFVPGQGGLPTLRLEAQLTGTLPDGWQSGGGATYSDSNFPERLGWREIVVQSGEGVTIQDSSVSDTDKSNMLHTYPADMLESPLDVRAANFTLAPGAAGDIGSRATSVQRPSSSFNRPTDRVAALISAKELTPPVIALSLLLALFWGAAHALSPGHGKTVVAAYLVGSRGTAKHAAFLGLTVTITHTIGVFALGAITLWLSRYLLPEKLYPWLNVASGLLVVVIGAALVIQRMRSAGAHSSQDHAHKDTTSLGPDGQWQAVTHAHGGRAHTHLPPSAVDGRMTWRNLLALGVSGGLIPCPSALVLLLGAVALGRIGFGMVLVISFSFGLAVVLTAIGLLMVYARRFFDRFSFEARLPRLLPVASALVVVLAGFGIILGALKQAGVL
jgi:ABC-type nickel/cobalt efflux system permease component RcnA